MNPQAKKRLQELREELKKIQEVLALDLENWKPDGKPGMLGLQRASRDKMPQVVQEIGTIILQNSSVHFMGRDHKSSVENVKKAKAAVNGIAIDYLVLEKNMLKQFYPNQTSDFRIFTDTVIGMNDFMFKIGKDIGAMSMPSVSLIGNDYGSYKTKEDLVYKLEAVLDRSYKGELKPMFFVKSLMDIIGEDNSKDNYQILLYNAPEDDNVLNRDTRLFNEMSGIQVKVLKTKKEEK
jgi:hypothetical protein